MGVEQREESVTFVVIAIAIVVIVLIALAPRIIEASRIMSRAREDYLRCRGTNHARILQSAIKRHQEALRVLYSARDNIEHKLQRVNNQITEELRQVLITYLVNSRFTNIPGIGSTLRDRIVRTCFDGTLDSLNRSPHVRGVGPEKAAAIRAWVYQMNRVIPALLKSDFPGKQDVLEKHQAERQQLVQKREDLSEKIITRERVIDRAREGLASFAGVTIADFRKALRGNREASRKIADYSLGAFAEWDSMPEWFAAILTEPEEG